MSLSVTPVVRGSEDSGGTCRFRHCLVLFSFVQISPSLVTLLSFCTDITVTHTHTHPFNGPIPGLFG